MGSHEDNNEKEEAQPPLIADWCEIIPESTKDINWEKWKELSQDLKALVHNVIVPELSQLCASKVPDLPEYEGDPLYLSPEQETEIYLEILRSRSVNRE